MKKIFLPLFCLLSTLSAAQVHHVNVNINQPVFVASAGNDITLCHGSGDTLHASGGTSYIWSPSYGLSCTTCPNPYAKPDTTTIYIVKGTNQYGCTVWDTIVVTVAPSLIANAGPDTTVYYGKSITLHASGGTNYTWSPSTGLSSTTIPNPTASPDSTITYTVTVSSGECTPAKDSVKVTVLPIAGVQSEIPPRGTSDFVTLYPNPNDGKFTFSFESIQKANYEIELRDVLGRVVLAEHLEKFIGHYSKQFDLASYPKGFYSLLVRTGTQRIVVKVLKY